MIEQINLLIQINLLLCVESEGHSLKLTDFRDHTGAKLREAKMVAEIMQRKQLIKQLPLNESHFELTEFGQEIASTGGWLTYLEKQKTDRKRTKENSEKIVNNEMDTNFTAYFKAVNRFFNLSFSNRKDAD